jgi:D-sedoheptulose 7-phosphate isomerase
LEAAVRPGPYRLPMNDAVRTRVAASLAAAHADLETFIADEHSADRIANVAGLLAFVLRSGGRILAVGNGGSACDAMHFCEELTGRFRNDRRPLSAMACTDPGHITCTANDFGYEHVFGRWVLAHGREGDALIALSTSGNSRNILRAVEAAGSIGMTRVALLGQGGGVLTGLCEHQWIVPGGTSDRIQEIHMLILHILVEAIEVELGL